MGALVTISSRVRRQVLSTLNRAQGILAKSLQVSFARSDNLSKSMAQFLTNGQRVVLLDVDYGSALFGQKQTIEEGVRSELISSGGKPALAGQVINLDHHNEELGHLTATELAFKNLDMLRSLEGEVVAVINHGDTDSILSSYVANNPDRIYSAAERELLIAAARAGDHSEGDFLAPRNKLTDAVRLNLALDAICLNHKLSLRQVWGASETQIRDGMQSAYALIESTLIDRRTLHTPETEALMEKNPTRSSYRAVEDASQGKDVPGVRIFNSSEGHTIVIVDASTPGLNDFNPIPAYQASSNPAIILIQRNGRIVGIGRNNDYKEWLNLMGSEEVEGIYTRFGMRLKGGAHAGGANVARDAFDTLPSAEEALPVFQQFLRESLARKAA